VLAICPKTSIPAVPACFKKKLKARQMSLSRVAVLKMRENEMRKSIDERATSRAMNNDDNARMQNTQHITHTPPSSSFNYHS